MTSDIDHLPRESAALWFRHFDHYCSQDLDVAVIGGVHLQFNRQLVGGLQSKFLHGGGAS